MKTEKRTSEKINFSAKDVPLIKKVIENVEKITYIQNNSMFIKDDGELEIFDTQASFLINFGIQYHIEIMKESK